MIAYDSGQWGLAFIWQLHGSVFPKGMAWALPCAALAVGLQLWLSENDEMRGALGVDDSTRSIIAGYTSVLGFLIVFRSQQAYSRWWEAGTLLQQLRGEWFNAYSNILAFCSSDADKQENRKLFEAQMVRLMSLLYCTALQHVTTMTDESFEVIGQECFAEESMTFLLGTHNKVEMVLQWIQRLIVENTRNGTLDIAPPIMSRVFQELSRGIVNVNNVHKITEFPFPFPYSQMITVLLLFQSVITPVFCAASMKTPWWAGLSTFILIFAFVNVNYIASEIEMPCGDDANDLPLKEMQKDWNFSLAALLQPEAQQPPTFSTRLTKRKASQMLVLHVTDMKIKKLSRSQKKISLYKTGPDVEMGLLSYDDAKVDAAYDGATDTAESDPKHVSESFESTNNVKTPASIPSLMLPSSSPTTENALRQVAADVVAKLDAPFPRSNDVNAALNERSRRISDALVRDHVEADAVPGRIREEALREPDKTPTSLAQTRAMVPCHENAQRTRPHFEQDRVLVGRAQGPPPLLS
eukprot:TRINITY_DN11437_c0_g2_i1.p1 TRINITY_DN11437_c0_g2~~TRINITY_DN11437_c0_g2_i1.p1  ORF type:complete len:524 (+),score=72.37 TRINITY_DN11437_c0_g2_i1:62-1633(+)